MGQYFEFYNNRRLNWVLGYHTIVEVHGAVVSTPVALRALSFPVVVIHGDEFILNTSIFCLDNG